MAWPKWKIILAYIAMFLIALASVWFIDRRVHLLPTTRPSSSAAMPIEK